MAAIATSLGVTAAFVFCEDFSPLVRYSWAESLFRVSASLSYFSGNTFFLWLKIALLFADWCPYAGFYFLCFFSWMLSLDSSVSCNQFSRENWLSGIRTCCHPASSQWPVRGFSYYLVLSIWVISSGHLEVSLDCRVIFLMILAWKNSIKQLPQPFNCLKCFSCIARQLVSLFQLFCSSGRIWLLREVGGSHWSQGEMFLP